MDSHLSIGAFGMPKKSHDDSRQFLETPESCDHQPAQLVGTFYRTRPDVMSFCMVPCLLNRVEFRRISRQEKQFDSSILVFHVASYRTGPVLFTTGVLPLGAQVVPE